MDDSVSSRPVSFSGHCKVVISDVDGTFLQDDKQVSSGVMAAIRELQDRGIPFLFASGRMFGAIADWVRDLKLTAPQIVNNGAEIVQPDGTPLCQHCLSHEAVLWLIEEGRKAGFEPVLFTQGDHIYSDTHPVAGWLIERNKEHISVVSHEKLLSPELKVRKFLFLADERAGEFPAFQDYLNRSGQAAGHNLKVFFSEHGILNACHPEATKLLAINRLCNILGCGMEDVMAVGDADNDAEMVGGVGLGVAMGNASPLTASRAAVRVGDNAHDGLAEAIRNYAWS